MTKGRLLNFDSKAIKYFTNVLLLALFMIFKLQWLIAFQFSGIAQDCNLCYSI